MSENEFADLLVPEDLPPDHRSGHQGTRNHDLKKRRLIRGDEPPDQGEYDQVPVN